MQLEFYQHKILRIRTTYLQPYACSNIMRILSTLLVKQTEICRFKIYLMSSPPSSFYFFSEDLQQDMCSPISTVPDMMSTQRKRTMTEVTDNQKDLTLQVFKKNTKMIYIQSLLQEYTITRTDKRKCTNQQINQYSELT